MILIHNLQQGSHEEKAIANSWMSKSSLDSHSRYHKALNTLQINLEAEGFKLALIIADGTGKDLKRAT